MTEIKKIAPPAPLVKGNRTVRVPPTVGEFDTSEVVPDSNKTRADFREEEFTKAILQHGKHVVWRKAILCVCLSETTGQASLDCDECDSSGYLYIDPLDIQAHMAAFDAETKLFQKFGMWQEGSVSVTVMAKYRLGYRDSIELKDSIMSFNEILKKGNRRGTRSKLPASTDSARYRIAQVTRMAFRTAAGATAFATPGQDFVITEHGWIEWTPVGNARIAAGTLLSVLYDHHPVYIVVSWPHATRDDLSGRKASLKPNVISLPIQAMAKLDFIVDVNTPARTTGT